MTKPDIEIIIPTLASKGRHSSLMRAIKSVLSQNEVTTNVIVVVNGDHACNQVVTDLQSFDDVRVLFQKKGSAPLAHLTGRKSVTAEYYGFLDDDDILLPGALYRRKAALLKNSEIDVVVENGWKKYSDRREPVISDISLCQKDPVLSLLSRNWMASCSGLYRTSSIGIDSFENYTEYAEWTFLAFKLTSFGKFQFLPDMGFIINVTANSLSTSQAYRKGNLHTIRQMIMLEKKRKEGVRKRILKLLKEKQANAFHSEMDMALQIAEYGKAWQFFFQSVLSPYGWKYLLGFRHILLEQWNQSWIKTQFWG